MSWKNVKEHYRIGHIVRITSEGICIGSPYISNLIVIGLDGVLKKRGTLRSNQDLTRYVAEMDADPAKLKALVESSDVFGDSVVVYTYDGGTILEKKCEAVGWPNVTHDGCLMYENMFSSDKAQVVRWAKRNAALGVKEVTRRVAEIEADLANVRGRLQSEIADLAALERDYP